MARSLRTSLTILVCTIPALGVGLGCYFHAARLRAESSPRVVASPETAVDPHPSVTPEDEEFLRSIRAQIGSVVPVGGLLDPAKTEDPAKAKNRVAESESLMESTVALAGVQTSAPQLTTDDELAIAIREMEQRVERRARHEAAQGNWDLGIALHQLAVQMNNVVSGPKSVP